MIITDTTMPLSGASQTLARNLMARLNSAYPAFDGFWNVTVNEGGGVVEVTNLALSGRWGFLMHTARIDPEGRKVVGAAGELLERYRIARSGTNAKIWDQVAAAKRDWKGDMVADHG